MSEEIKPCPFCGKTPKRAYQYGWQYGTTEKPGHGLWAIEHICAPGHGNSEAEAIAAWNRRA